MSFWKCDYWAEKIGVADVHELCCVGCHLHLHAKFEGKGRRIEDKEYVVCCAVGNICLRNFSLYTEDDFSVVNEN